MERIPKEVMTSIHKYSVSEVTFYLKPYAATIKSNLSELLIACENGENGLLARQSIEQTIVCYQHAINNSLRD